LAWAEWGCGRLVGEPFCCRTVGPPLKKNGSREEHQNCTRPSPRSHLHTPYSQNSPTYTLSLAALAHAIISTYTRLLIRSHLHVRNTKAYARGPPAPPPLPLARSLLIRSLLIRSLLIRSLLIRSLLIRSILARPSRLRDSYYKRGGEPVSMAICTGITGSKEVV
jgi:hypothetical protein